MFQIEGGGISIQDLFWAPVGSNDAYFVVNSTSFFNISLFTDLRVRIVTYEWTGVLTIFVFIVVFSSAIGL